jgi:hypothetical protein
VVVDVDVNVNVDGLQIVDSELLQSPCLTGSWKKR